jgi:ATP-dependent helicase/nuclease subunit B
METIKLFTIPASKNFLAELSQYILGKRFDPLQFSNSTIILPTERACLTLEKEIMSQAKGRSLMMPSIKAITQWVQSSDLSVRILSPTERHLLLSQFLKERTSYSWQECFSITSSLTELLDELYTEEISYERLEAVVPEELSKHWQENLELLRLVTCEWPIHLKNLKQIEAIPSRTYALEEQARIWKDSPLKGVLIAAGIIGSVPSIARFLRVISELPTGEVIFPNVDLEMEKEQWEKLPPYHPQYSLKQTLERMGYKRENVQLLTTPSEDCRAVLVRNLFDQKGLYNPSSLKLLQHNTSKTISLIEATSLQEEARIISLMIRESLNTPDQTVALVTPHRGLSDRVTSELKRWKIVPNDSYGVSLFETPMGAFLMLILKVVSEPHDMVTLLSLLKHPLTLLGFTAADCRRISRRLETDYILPLSPFAQFEPKHIKDFEISSFYEAFCQALSPLLLSKAPLSEWVKRHSLVVDRLSKGLKSSENTQKESRQEEEGIFLLINQLQSTYLPQHDLTLKEYKALLSLHLKKGRATQAYGMHPRVHILGVLEARLLSFDRVILGGMNDSHWAPSCQPGPWLSYDMKQQIGFPDEAYQVGLTASNWAHLMHSPEVIITRSQREEGTIMLASRWLMRLKAIAQSREAHTSLEPSQPWKEWAARLDESSFANPCKPPKPCPPLARRPRQLAVTDIQLWYDDPYALYAKKILKIAPLPKHEKDLTPAAFGIAVHKALEKYLLSPSSEQTVERLYECGRQAFGILLNNVLVQLLWWPRFLRICDWFQEEHQKRRLDIQVSWAEAQGTFTFQAPGGSFTAIAKADRIDQFKDGSLDIIDYKTGTLSSRRAVEQGETLQLPLEALITQQGSWQNISNGKIKSLSFWQLKGGIPPATILSFEQGEKLAEVAFSKLKEIVFLFDQEKTPYIANAQASNVYDPLARRQEWKL